MTAPSQTITVAGREWVLRGRGPGASGEERVIYPYHSRTTRDIFIARWDERIGVAGDDPEDAALGLEQYLNRLVASLGVAAPGDEGGAEQGSDALVGDEATVYSPEPAPGTAKTLARRRDS